MRWRLVGSADGSALGEMVGIAVGGMVGIADGSAVDSAEGSSAVGGADGTVQEMTPGMLRRFLRANARQDSKEHGNVPEQIAAVPGLALQLFEFCLIDCRPAGVTAALRAIRARQAANAFNNNNNNNGGGHAQAAVAHSNAVVTANAVGGGMGDGGVGALASFVERDVEDEALLSRLWAEFQGAPLLPLP